MKKFILLNLLILSISGLWAQGYTTAAGIRLGKQMGVSINQKIVNKLSVEGILQHDSNEGGYAKLLLKRHTNVLTKGISLYFGGGAHYGYGSANQNIKGITGVAGIELSLFRLNVSLDYMPMYHVSQPEGLNSSTFQSGGAMSIRYILVKNSGKKKRQRTRSKKKRALHLKRAEKGREKQNRK